MSGNGFSEMLNRMDNVESVYEYDRIKVEEYETAKNDALNLWNQLEEEKQDLEDTKASLEADKASLESQKAELDTLLVQLKEQSDNYEAQITKAKQEASVAKAKLQQKRKEDRSFFNSSRHRTNRAEVARAAEVRVVQAPEATQRTVPTLQITIQLLMLQKAVIWVNRWLSMPASLWVIPTWREVPA